MSVLGGEADILVSARLDQRADAKLEKTRFLLVVLADYFG